MACEQQIIGSYECALIGDPGVGKTSFVKRHVTGEFVNKYGATVGVAEQKIDFYMSRGIVRFTVLDTTGPVRSGNISCGIIMFDITRLQTLENVPNWYYELDHRVCENIPIVVCGNKLDALTSTATNENSVWRQKLVSVWNKLPFVLRDNQPLAENLASWQRKNHVDYTMSVKNKHNYEKPFLDLARKLVKDDALDFVAQTAHYPPEIEVDYHQDFQNVISMQAADCPFPVDHDL